MVFTSSVPLAELQGVEERLRSRLEGGLVVDLPAPETEIRERVLSREIEARLGSPDGELAKYLASRPVDSLRAALGLLQRVLEAAGARGEPPTLALARETLDGPPASPAPAPRESATRRSSGIVAPSAAGTRSREKMVWEWPDIGERTLEEWR
jgi:chromosomal replication initiation ATPase DnaA